MAHGRGIALVTERYLPRTHLDCDENELSIDVRSLIGGDLFEKEADGAARKAGVHPAVVTGRVAS